MRRLLLILLVLSFPLCSFTQNRHQKTNAKTTVVSKRLTKHHRTPKSKAIKKQSKKKNNKVRRKANASQTSIHSLQRQRAAIQRKIRQQEAALRANRNAVHQRLQNLMLINGEIDQSQQKIDGIQKDIDHINGNIGILKGQLSTLEQQLQDRKAKYIRSMRYMSRHHSVQDKLMFIFSAKNFAQMYRRLQFIRQYSAYQKAQGRIVEAKQLEVNRKHHQLVNVKGHKNVLLYKGKIEKNNLQVKHGQQQQVVESLKDQQKTIQEIIAAQHKKNAALNAQIDRLVAQEVARERAAAAAEARRKSAEAAKKRAQMLAQKRAAAAAAAAANAQRVAQAKAREAQLKAAARAAEEARQKATEEAVAARQAQTEATKKAQTIAAARKAEEARQAQAAATARKAEADQAAREAEADREAAERKAQADAERNQKEIAVAKQQEQNTLNLTAVDRMMSSGFEANRGRLPMPITGNYHIVSHFGEYNVAGLKGVTLDNKGINILGGPGAMARSIYDGEVSYVFSYGGSMVVMIRHGAYISVYCNLKSVSVHKGQKVHTRQLLGAVCPDHILQFQLRRETAKLNPEVWLER